jgi:hypothetical protein
VYTHCGKISLPVLVPHDVPKQRDKSVSFRDTKLSELPLRETTDCRCNRTGAVMLRGLFGVKQSDWRVPGQDYVMKRFINCCIRTMQYWRSISYTSVESPERKWTHERSRNRWRDNKLYLTLMLFKDVECLRKVQRKDDL